MVQLEQSNKKETDVKKTVEIFWTGGYDSTFRVLQLSRLPIKIRPYYLSDNRKSEQNELSAIYNITAILKGKKETQCEILPLEIISKSQRIQDDLITESFQRLLSRDHMGSQYEWLGWFSKNHRGIELSIHEDDKAMNLINKHGKLILVSDEIIGEYYIVDTTNSHEDVCAVFGNFHFPLATFTKIKMKEHYLAWGCKEIINLTWFCYQPINGKPCGMCNPCKYTIEEGMTGHFTKMALLRNKLIPVKKILITIKKQLRKTIL